MLAAVLLLTVSFQEPAAPPAMELTALGSITELVRTGDLVSVESRSDRGGDRGIRTLVVYEAPDVFADALPRYLTAPPRVESDGRIKKRFFQVAAVSDAFLSVYVVKAVKEGRAESKPFVLHLPVASFDGVMESAGRYAERTGTPLPAVPVSPDSEEDQ